MTEIKQFLELYETREEASNGRVFQINVSDSPIDKNTRVTSSYLSLRLDEEDLKYLYDKYKPIWKDLRRKELKAEILKLEEFYE